MNNPAHPRRNDDPPEAHHAARRGAHNDPAAQADLRHQPWSATIIYLLALLLIAGISLSSELLTQKIIARQETTALMVNVAGRQRMLSQRITRVADEIADHSRDVVAGQGEILALAQRMETSQHQLVDGDISHGMLPATSAGLRNIYFGSPLHLQEQVNSFLVHARSFAAQPAPLMQNPDLIALRQAVAAPLLDGLDAAVNEYQAASEMDIRHLQHVMGTLTGLMLLVLVLEALLIYRPLFNRLSGTISLLIKASTTDFLTGILNRRAFFAAAERALANAASRRQPLCLVMADVDHFKRINDTYGHPVGDTVIRHFAQVAGTSLRKADALGRVGGEEFAILLPGTTLQGGMAAAERIRGVFANTTVAGAPGAEPIGATVSIGVICVSSGSVDEMFMQADQLLYRAKQSGRNRVESGWGTPDRVPDWIPARAQTT